MTQTAQEIVTKPGSEISIVDLDINSEKISALSLRCKELPQDLNEPENYRMSQDVINEAREMRGKITKAGKLLKEDAAKWCKKVVKDEKRLDGEIVKFLDPEAARKKVHDDKIKAEKERKRIAEQLRKDAHLEKINSIRMLISEAQGKKSPDIELVIEKLNAIEVNGSYEEFESEAHGIWEDTDLALQRLLINAQTVEEEDRKRAVEDERLRLERKAVADEKAENERIRLANEEVTRKNEADAQALVDAESEKERIRLADIEAAEKRDTEISENNAPKVESTQNAPGISAKIQDKIDDDNSVIAQCRRNAHAEILAVIEENKVLSKAAVASNILDAIIDHKIPNVRYDIY